MSCKHLNLRYYGEGNVIFVQERCPDCGERFGPKPEPESVTCVDCTRNCLAYCPHFDKPQEPKAKLIIEDRLGPGAEEREFRKALLSVLLKLHDGIDPGIQGTALDKIEALWEKYL